MLFDKLACLTTAGVSGLVIDAETRGKIEHFFLVPADILYSEGAAIESVLSLRTRIGNDDLVVRSLLLPLRRQGCTLGVRCVASDDGDEANLGAEHPSYYRLPGFVVGGGFHPLGHRSVRCATSKTSTYPAHDVGERIT